MKIHWYWPFARPEEITLAHSTVLESEDQIRIDVIDRNGAPEPTLEGSVEIHRSLPDVDRSQRHAVSWLLSRAATYAKRAQTRRQIWRNHNFDLVHIHYLNRFTDAFLRSKQRPILVVSVHDVVPHNPRWPTWLETQLLNRIYRHADALVVHHESLRQELAEKFGLAHDKIHVIGHQVFPVTRSNDETEPPGSTPTVLFFGALRKNKGIPILVQAIKDLPASVDVHFQFAGHGEPELETQLLELSQADDRVDAEIGFVSLERKAQLFARSTIVVLPYTQFSSQSGVLHDAYGHGRPVIVSDVGALGHSVREDGTGLVVRPSDHVALATALKKLLADPALLIELGDQAKRIAAERSPERLGAELRTLYAQLMQTKAP